MYILCIFQVEDCDMDDHITYHFFGATFDTNEIEKWQILGSIFVLSTRTIPNQL